jgi:triosephosphate isomerase
MVAGNWKMHGDRALARELAATSVHSARAHAGVDVVLIPPFTLLDTVADALGESAVGLGAQDLSEHVKGAYTGEVSSTMLAEAGCRYVLVGHSERRQYHGECDERVARKFMAAQAAGIIPILCVGETRLERESGQTETVVSRQLDAVIGLAGVAALEQAVLAYEPVWAIGTGLTATPAQAQAVHDLLRSGIEARDARIARSLRILYGGSVKADNARGLFDQPDIDGGLVGGAALVAADFSAIVAAAHSH